jgi:hypothetical protein
MWLWCFLRQRGDAKPRIGRRPALPKFLTPTPLVGPPTPPGRVPAGAPTGWERVVAAKLVLRPRGHAGRRERGARPELDDPLSASSRLARKVGMVRSLVVAGRGSWFCDPAVTLAGVSAGEAEARRPAPSRPPAPTSVKSLRHRLPQPAIQPLQHRLVPSPRTSWSRCSPNDRPGEVLAKVADWLEAGSRLVWVVDPRRRHVHVYRADGTESLVTTSGSLDGEDVLPGFTCAVDSVL